MYLVSAFIFADFNSAMWPTDYKTVAGFMSGLATILSVLAFLE